MPEDRLYETTVIQTPHLKVRKRHRCYNDPRKADLRTFRMISFTHRGSRDSREHESSHTVLRMGEEGTEQEKTRIHKRSWLQRTRP
ncbi:hypothetical protein AVEN_137628-1 [Araneus ventricosus]|uniref:Uncharacterized protein n=1 Tax=Araneus ventricosus TaxID=182803 RepID=A0A4Y2W141_ARAVE|nr:hypothetical protein AVEN_137628-1 [Araneus ventricosus]